MILYGIPNCNTVKKARDWLASSNIAYTFHDFKKLGATTPILENWLSQIPHEKLINRAGLTWRGLDDASKNSITNNAAAIALMQAKPSLIKRPILELNSKIIALGFDETTYMQLLTKKI
jgi:arsenate reductase (glutaredoxin)